MKCSYCKEPIDTQKDRFLKDKESTKTPKAYHTDCFIKCMTTRKRSPLAEDYCKALAEEYETKTKQEYKILEDKERLYKFIEDMYMVSFFPSYFFVKFESVFNGSYKGLNKAVPPEDLLDMWTQKKENLLKLAENDKKKGKEIDGISRVNYDLAVLLSKYDSYLAWKEQQKIAKAEYEEKKNKDINLVRYEDISRPSSKKGNIKPIDITSILDEI